MPLDGEVAARVYVLSLRDRRDSVTRDPLDDLSQLGHLLIPDKQAIGSDAQAVVSIRGLRRVRNPPGVVGRHPEQLSTGQILRGQIQDDELGVVQLDEVAFNGCFGTDGQLQTSAGVEPLKPLPIGRTRLECADAEQSDARCADSRCASQYPHKKREGLHESTHMPPARKTSSRTTAMVPEQD